MTYKEAKEKLLSGGFLCIKLARHFVFSVNGVKIRRDTADKLFDELDLVLDGEPQKDSYKVLHEFYKVDLNKNAPEPEQGSL